MLGRSLEIDELSELDEPESESESLESDESEMTTDFFLTISYDTFFISFHLAFLNPNRKNRHLIYVKYYKNMLLCLKITYPHALVKCVNIYNISLLKYPRGLCNFRLIQSKAKLIITKLLTIKKNYNKNLYSFI